MPTRTVPNTALKAGDRITTSDGWVTLTGDAAPTSDPNQVSATISVGILHLDAHATSTVLGGPAGGDNGGIDEEYLFSNQFTNGEIELFSLGHALGRGRALGVDDAATIAWYCLHDVDDRVIVSNQLGIADDQLQPTHDAAIALIDHYLRGEGSGPRRPGAAAEPNGKPATPHHSPT